MFHTLGWEINEIQADLLSVACLHKQKVGLSLTLLSCSFQWIVLRDGKYLVTVFKWIVFNLHAVFFGNLFLLFPTFYCHL